MKYLILIFTCISFLAYSQEKEPFNNDVTKIPNYSYIKTKIDLSNIPPVIDKAPEFPGGINTFRNKFTQKVSFFNVKSEPGQTLTTKVYFIIERDGTISNVFAIGDKKYSEAVEKAIKKIKDTWSPAIANGEPVRFLFTWPLQLMDH